MNSWLIMGGFVLLWILSNQPKISEVAAEEKKPEPTPPEQIPDKTENKYFYSNTCRAIPHVRYANTSKWVAIIDVPEGMPNAYYVDQDSCRAWQENQLVTETKPIPADQVRIITEPVDTTTPAPIEYAPTAPTVTEPEEVSEEPAITPAPEFNTTTPDGSNMVSETEPAQTEILPVQPTQSYYFLMDALARYWYYISAINGRFANRSDPTKSYVPSAEEKQTAAELVDQIRAYYEVVMNQLKNPYYSGMPESVIRQDPFKYLDELKQYKDNYLTGFFYEAKVYTLSPDSSIYISPSTFTPFSSPIPLGAENAAKNFEKQAYVYNELIKVVENYISIVKGA